MECESTRNVLEIKMQEITYELSLKAKNLLYKFSLKLCFWLPNSKPFWKKYIVWLLLAPILPLLVDSKIYLDTVDDTTVSDTPSWSRSEPQICLSLTKTKQTKKHRTNPEMYAH